MLRVILLSLCLGCMGTAQQVPSCRIEVPAAVLGTDPLVLALDYSPRDLSIRLDGHETSGGLAIDHASQLVVLVDHRESMADVWTTATHVLQEVVSRVAPEERYSLVVLDKGLPRIEGIAQAHNGISNFPEQPPFGRASLYDSIAEVSDSLRPGDTILVLTSGMDTPPAPDDMTTLRTSLLRRGVRISTVLLLQQGELAVDSLMGPSELKWLAYRTGGSATALKPLRQASSDALLPDKFMTEVMNYSALQLQLPEGGAPERLVVNWKHGGKDWPPFVVPDTVGPCPAAVSASLPGQH